RSCERDPPRFRHGRRIRRDRLRLPDSHLRLPGGRSPRRYHLAGACGRADCRFRPYSIARRRGWSGAVSLASLDGWAEEEVRLEPREELFAGLGALAPVPLVPAQAKLPA